MASLKKPLKGPLDFFGLTLAPSTVNSPFWRAVTYSSRVIEVNPHLQETTTFCLPGILYLARRRASMALPLCWSLVRIESKAWPMLTRATSPMGLPNARRIPICSLCIKNRLNNEHCLYMGCFLVPRYLSAPAQESILFMRMT